jgi:hypothetical protein
MKALSIRPPWAGLIASGQKTIELRSRRTYYRGELLVCESRGGGAVAVVDLLDCREATSADARAACVENVPPGYFAWEIRLVRRVTSAPIKGRLNFYDVPESVVQDAI